MCMILQWTPGVKDVTFYLQTDNLNVSDFLMILNVSVLRNVCYVRKEFCNFWYSLLNVSCLHFHVTAYKMRFRSLSDNSNFLLEAKKKEKIVHQTVTIKVPEKTAATNILTNAVVLNYIIHVKVEGYPEMKLPIIIGTIPYDENQAMQAIVGNEEGICFKQLVSNNFCKL